MTLPKTTSYDVVVIGAGAAGLMCAIEAGKRGRSVVVLEHNATIGKKIRISGGGRCNFTNLHTTANNYVTENAHFPKSALARFTPKDFCQLVEQYQIPYHEKKLGQLFCDGSSQAIIDQLKKECERHGVRILTEVHVDKVIKEDRFIFTTGQGLFQSQSLVIASGGLSIPTLGATNFGYNLAKQFAIKVNPCRPGLVPLTLAPADLNILKDLAGVSVDALVSFEKISFRENILFTHKGLSGPAILQISSYWQPKKPISINLVVAFDMTSVLQAHHHEKTTLKNFLKDYLPSRLTDILCSHYLENLPLNAYSATQLKTIGEFLNGWKLTPNGTEGYAKAEVTVGGVDTDELSSKTMEAKKVSGLYFIGEVVDVTGHLGGFNFQWAWASGFAAGQYV